MLDMIGVLNSTAFEIINETSCALRVVNNFLLCVWSAICLNSKSALERRLERHLTPQRIGTVGTQGLMIHTKTIGRSRIEYSRNTEISYRIFARYTSVPYQQLFTDKKSKKHSNTKPLVTCGGCNS
jgi:hypothetical protein